MDEVLEKLVTTQDPDRIKSRAREFEAELKSNDWKENRKIPFEEIVHTDNTIVQSEEDKIGSVFKHHVDRMIEIDPDFGKRFRSVSEPAPEIDLFDEEQCLVNSSDIEMRKMFKILGPEANSVTKPNVEVFIMISSAYLESSLVR